MQIASPKLRADAATAAEAPYSLPPFLRTLWVSEKARAAWQPRLQQIRAASRIFELDAVAAGVLPAVLRWIAAEEYDSAAAACVERKLKILPLSVERRRSPQPSALGHARSGIFMQAAIGQKKQAKQLAHAWTKSGQEAIGPLLGYPVCCSRFYAEAHRDSARPEILWSAATRSVEEPASAAIDIHAGYAMNVFWRPLGVSLLPHIPCSFACAESLALAQRLAEFAAQGPYAAEFAWVQEILRWPLEWSTLHGIAELKTPVLKMSTNAAPGASKKVVRWHGDIYPAEGGKGLSFPYRQELNPSAARFTAGLTVIQTEKSSTE